MKIFEYFLCISMVQTQDSLALGHFIPGGHHFNKLGKGLLGACYLPNLKHLSPTILKKKIFEYVLCISMIQTQDPLAWGHFITKDLNLNKLGKGSLGHATYPISST